GYHRGRGRALGLDTQTRRLRGLGGNMKRMIIAAALVALASPACAFDLGIVAFQMSSETHARVANAAKDAATAKGWKLQVLNPEGSLPKHAQQLDDLIQRK